MQKRKQKSDGKFSKNKPLLCCSADWKFREWRQSLNTHNKFNILITELQNHSIWIHSRCKGEGASGTIYTTKAIHECILQNQDINFSLTYVRTQCLIAFSFFHIQWHLISCWRWCTWYLQTKPRICLHPFSVAFNFINSHCTDWHHACKVLEKVFWQFH